MAEIALVEKINEKKAKIVTLGNREQVKGLEIQALIRQQADLYDEQIAAEIELATLRASSEMAQSDKAWYLKRILGAWL